MVDKGDFCGGVHRGRPLVALVVVDEGWVVLDSVRGN